MLSERIDTAQNKNDFIVYDERIGDLISRHYVNITLDAKKRKEQNNIMLNFMKIYRYDDCESFAIGRIFDEQSLGWKIKLSAINNRGQITCANPEIFISHAVPVIFMPITYGQYAEILASQLSHETVYKTTGTQLETLREYMDQVDHYYERVRTLVHLKSAVCNNMPIPYVNTPVSQLHVSMPILRKIEKKGIKDIEQLEQVCFTDIPGIGASSAAEIKIAINKLISNFEEKL